MIRGIRGEIWRPDHPLIVRKDRKYETSIKTPSQYETGLACLICKSCFGIRPALVHCLGVTYKIVSMNDAIRYLKQY